MTPRDERGATLLEFLVYLGIISLVLVSATMFAGEFVLTNAKSVAIMQATRNARFASARVALDIREASGVNTGSSVFGSHPGALSLSSADSGRNPTVFSVLDGALVVQEGSNPPLPLTSDDVTVTEFVVDDISTGVKTRAYRIRLTAEYADQTWAATSSSVTFEQTAKVEKDHGFGP